MKTWKTSLALLAAGSALVAALSVQAAVESPTIGHQAPAFSLPGVGGRVNLAALRGKVVYLDFWASWCAPCKESFPWLNEMQAKYGAAGFTVVAVNVDAKPTDAETFLTQVPAKFTLAFDPNGETPGRYQAKGMPSSFLIDRDGRIVSAHVGFRGDQKVALENKIRQVLGVQ
jgi:thiol-disulfide isomerase/thioredoxin